MVYEDDDDDDDDGGGGGDDDLLITCSIRNVLFPPLNIVFF
jgi:hypothetical protein